MPTLRQLIFMVMGMIIGWYLCTLHDHLTLDKEEKLPEQKYFRQINATTYNDVRLWIQKSQRNIENRLLLGAPIKKYCAFSEKGVEILRSLLSEYEWDPIDIRKLEEIFDDRERILDLCGVCPPIVQLHDNHSTRHSDQAIQQMSILPEMFTLPLNVLLLIITVVTGVIIGWHLFKILLRRIVNEMSTFREMVLLATGVVIGWYYYREIDMFNRHGVEMITCIFGSFSLLRLALLEMYRSYVRLYQRVHPSGRRMPQTPTLRKLLFMAFECFIWTSIWFAWMAALYFTQHLVNDKITSFIEEYIGLSSFVSLSAIAYVTPPYTVIIISAMFFLKNRFFKVDHSAEQTLLHMELILQIYKNSERMVVNRLAAGATRDQLRPFEDGAVRHIGRIKNVKSASESNLFIKWMWRTISSTGEETIDVCERILYLCRPAIAA